MHLSPFLAVTRPAQTLLQDLLHSRLHVALSEEEMNVGKCTTCGYVNESATAMCSRADCALTPKCGAVTPAGRATVFMPCTLRVGHAGDHVADNGLRWSGR